jgi:hypothetical protein
MPRPRQQYNDCVVAVFRELTGEEKRSAEVRFIPYLTGKPGTTSDVLRTYLTNVGWTMAPDDAINEYVGPDGSIDMERLAAHWRCFQGEAVMFYTVDGQETGHAVVVRAGGIVLDPRPSAPEEGEFIRDYFKSLGRNIGITDVFRVAKLG